jgi:hypothetical protein
MEYLFSQYVSSCFVCGFCCFVLLCCVLNLQLTFLSAFVLFGTLLWYFDHVAYLVCVCPVLESSVIIWLSFFSVSFHCCGFRCGIFLLCLCVFLRL